MCEIKSSVIISTIKTISISWKLLNCITANQDKHCVLVLKITINWANDWLQRINPLRFIWYVALLCVKIGNYSSKKWILLNVFKHRLHLYRIWYSVPFRQCFSSPGYLKALLGSMPARCAVMVVAKGGDGRYW